MSLHESGEMYLETILVLSLKGGYVRSIDVAEYMGYSKPSVSRGMGILKEKGLVIMDDNGHLTLTDDGRKIAEKIYERHVVLEKLLMKIGVSEDTASRDACRIEHFISDETFNAIKKCIAEKKIV
ncbi:MAG: metal-dependent transcriptional regulator [Clostridia bacterium]|nr:metal-dependent transcriptional regulator [Clostridia bacterium]